MKTRKTVFLALFALAISCGLIFYGCDLLFPPEPTPPTPSAIDFTVSANNNSNGSTESLSIGFTDDVTGLSQTDIRLEPSNVVMGALTGSGRSYKLAISFTEATLANNYDCKVTINRTGVTTAIKNATVTNTQGKAAYTVATDPVVGGKSKLKISLTKDVPSLARDNISVTGSATVATGATLGGSGKERTLDLAVTAIGSITVTITNQDVDPNAKTHPLADGTTATPPATIPATKVIIINYDSKYSPALKETTTKDNYQVGYKVEIGYPRKFKAVYIPTHSNSTVAWSVLDTSIAEVDTSGVVTGKRSGWTKLMAKTNDSGVGDFLDIQVVELQPPTSMKVNIMGSASYGGWNHYRQDITINPSGTVSLFYGDRDYKLKTTLIDASGNMINEQTVEALSNSSTFFTISRAPEENTESGVPGYIFTLTPKAVTTAVQKVTFQSAYKPSVNIDFEFTVTHSAPNSFDAIADITYYNASDEKLSGPKFPSANDNFITMVIESKVPIKAGSISVTAVGASNSDYIAISAPITSHKLYVAGKTDVFTLTKKNKINSNDWNGTGSVATVTVKVKDAMGVEKTKDVAVKGHANTSL